MAQLLFNKYINSKNLLTPEEAIIQSVENDIIESVIMVVPTGKLVRRLSHFTIRKYFEYHHKPVTKPNIFTLSNFLNFLYDKIYTDRNIHQISDSYRLSLLEEASENVNLLFYKKKDKKISPVILQRLANVIFGIKEDGITIEQIEKDLRDSDDGNIIDKDKLNDIYLLYSEYEKLLAGNYLDSHDILKKVFTYLSSASSTKDKLNELLANIDLLLFHGFSEFKFPEYEFLTLFKNTDVPFIINFDYSDKRGPQFGNYETNIIKLADSGLILSSTEKNDNADSEPLSNSNYLRENLFNDTYKKEDRFDNIIKICAADNRINEVESIAKLIKYLIVEQKYRPNEICVTMRNPNLYSNLFRDILSFNQIPVNVSDRYTLSTSSVIITIFSALNIINNGFRREDVNRFLQSPFIKSNKIMMNIDIDNLINLAYKYRILGGEIYGGAKYWEMIFKSKSKLFREYYETLLRNEKKDSIDLLNAKKNFESAQKAYDDFIALRKMFQKKKDKYLPDDFKSLIEKDIIKQFGIKDTIFNNFKQFLNDKTTIGLFESNIYEENIEKESQALNTFEVILEELAYITSDRKPMQLFRFNELMEKLKIIIIGAKYNIIEKQGYGVELTSIEQTRGIPYKVMILCGAIESEFPLSYKSETFLGKELKDSEIRHIFSEKIQFYQFLTNASQDLDTENKQIYIFYPKYEDDKKLIPSPFIGNLLEITTLKENLKVYDLEELKKEIIPKDRKDIITKQIKDLPWLNSITNESELAEQYADLIFSNKNIVNSQIYNSSQYEYKNIYNYLNLFYQNLSKNKGKIDINLLGEDKRLFFKNISKKEFSISELETYAKCPFKYFINKILLLDEDVLPDLSISPIDKGTVLHSIIYRFYEGVQQYQLENDKEMIKVQTDVSNLPILALVSLNPKNKSDYQNTLKKIAEEELSLIQFDHPYFNLEKEKLIGNKRKSGLLDLWLENELIRIKNNWNYKPGLFEFGFGLSLNRRNSTSLKAVQLDEDLKLKGKIDRIEFFKNKDLTWDIMIADYKSNIKNVNLLNDINKGNSFQMPLYLAAAQIILEQNYNLEVQPQGCVYYGFEPEYDSKNNEIIYHKFVLLSQDNHLRNVFHNLKPNNLIPSKSSLKEMIQNSIDKAKNIITDISSGLFPLTNDDNNCKYCNLISICRRNKRPEIFNTLDNNQSQS